MTDNRLPAGLDIDLFNRDLRNALAPVFVKRLHLPQLGRLQLWACFSTISRLLNI